MEEPKTPEEAAADIRRRMKRLDELGPFVETADAAGLLKWNQQTIRDHIKSGEIPSHRLGHKYKIPAMWVRLWLTRALIAVERGAAGRSQEEHG